MNSAHSLGMANIFAKFKKKNPSVEGDMEQTRKVN